MKVKPKHNWRELRIKYLYSETSSVKAFLDSEGIKSNGFVTRKTKGWSDEKQLFLNELENQTREKLLSSLSDTDYDVRKRQASTAKFMQEVAIKALNEHKPKSFSDVMRCLQMGLKEERDALGMNSNYSHKHSIEGKPVFMMTNYAKKLEKQLEKMSDEELNTVFQALTN